MITTAVQPFFLTPKRTLLLLSLHLLVAVGAMAATFLITATCAQAQDIDPAMQTLIEQMAEAQSPEPDAPLPTATTSPVNVEVQWRLWRRVIQEGAPGSDELEAMRRDAISLGIPSLPIRQLAVIAAARRAETYGLDADQVEELLEAADDLAPHLPYADWELASARLRGQPSAAYRAIPPYLQGVKDASQWLDSRVAWSLKGAVILLIATALSFVLFLFALMLRYFGIAAYEGTRVLPRGFSSTQTVILLLALVLVPGLLLQSPMLAMILLLYLLLPFQQLNERAVSLFFLIFLAALPFLDARLGQLVIYPESQAQQLLYAHYHGCQPDCPPWLEQAADDNEIAAYALAVHRFRNADHAAMDELHADLNSLPTTSKIPAAWANLQGALLVARGDAEAALPFFNRSITADPDRPEAWFNQMRALQILGDIEESQLFLAEAIDRDMSAVSRQMRSTRRDPNGFLMLHSLSAAEIWDAFAPPRDNVPSLIRPFWTAAAGERVRLEHTPILGIFGLLLLLLTTPLYLRGRLSSPCPKCGLARDPSNAQETNHHHYCLPCYQTFVSGATLDYHARVLSETTLGRRDRLQRFLRRLFSLITPGVGHIIGGHAIRGVLTFMALVVGVLLLLYPLGVWRLPFELFHEAWAGQKVIAWIFISLALSVGLTGALRGVEPTRLSTAASRRGGD